MVLLCGLLVGPKLAYFHKDAATINELKPLQRLSHALLRTPLAPERAARPPSCDAGPGPRVYTDAHTGETEKRKRCRPSGFSAARPLQHQAAIRQQGRRKPGARTTGRTGTNPAHGQQNATKRQCRLSRPPRQSPVRYPPAGTAGTAGTGRAAGCRDGGQGAATPERPPPPPPRTTRPRRPGPARSALTAGRGPEPRRQRQSRRRGAHAQRNPTPPSPFSERRYRPAPSLLSREVPGQGRGRRHRNEGAASSPPGPAPAGVTAARARARCVRPGGPGWSLSGFPGGRPASGARREEAAALGAPSGGMASCAEPRGAAGGRAVVREERLFRCGLRGARAQLACSERCCAFPLRGNELCVWSAAGGEPLRLRGHELAVSALSFGSRAGPRLLCSASRDVVRVWSLAESGQGVMPRGIVIGSFLGVILHVRFSPDDQQVAVCAEKQIYMLSAKNNAVLAELEGHLAPVTAAEFCTWEKNILVSVSEDRSFKIWDYSTGLLIYQSAVLAAFPLLSLLIDEENKQIITGCSDGQLWIFSLISDHNYRCVTRINLMKEQEKFYNKMGKSGQELDEGESTSQLCKTNSMRPEETVETTLPVLTIEHYDHSIFFHKEENLFPALNTSYLCIGSSTGLLVINLANFELEAVLSYKDYSGISIQFAGLCALTKTAVNGKVLCLISSMFEDMIAVLEVNLAELVRSQQDGFLICGKEKTLSVIARCPMLPKSPLHKGLKIKKPSCKRLGVKSTVKDQPLVYHRKIKSSGYATAPQMSMFSPVTNLKKSNELSKWKTSYKCKNKEYPLGGSPPIKYRKEISVAYKPTAISCIQYSGDGELLACGLADKSVLVFDSNLTDTRAVFSGHDGALNSVCWSHDKKWLVSASEDRTLRIWSVCNKEPALLMGKEKFSKSVRFAQFYYIDTFILLCCGAEFHLLSFYLDTAKDDLKYKQRSVCKLIEKFSMASTVEITSLSTVNDFYSYIVLTAGSNRALEIFDLNAGCSSAVIPEVHSRSVHQICQNKGSAFSTQQPEAYNLFMTTAVGDGIKLWDLRTLRCEHRFEGHVSRCHPCGIAVSPCGQFIASGSDDKSAYIYEMRSSTFLHKLGGHTDSVINVTFCPSSPQLTTATLDGKLQLFLP
ncbi:LOW QUALITY PROTEIN: WD repeat-containing protein 27 [Eudromia elegans]